MGLIDRLRTLVSWPEPTRSAWDAWMANLVQGYPYMLDLNQTMPGSKQEEMDGTFRSYVSGAYRGNGIVFACMGARLRLFTQARFKYRNLATGDLYGNPSLDILEHPWNNAVTGDLLARILQDVDLAGNAYIVRRSRTLLRRMRPDWVSIVSDRPADELDAQVLGYVYYPGGKNTGNGPEVNLLASEVAHVVEYPDPLANFRGMSWLTPVVREVMADGAATQHKLTFFENGATPNLVIKRSDAQELSKEKWQEWVKLMEAGHSGVANAYKTLYLSAGADATVVGANLRQLDFKLTQGAGETRIAAAAGVPPIIVGLSEGLQAATYANYGQARRAFGDLWGRWMWQNTAGSMATIVPPPSGSELWYDDSGIPFLREDQKDRADIEHVKAQSIRTLTDAGFKAESVIKAVNGEDMSLLKHSGLFSVQLQAPGSTKMPQGEVPGETPVGPGTKPETPMMPTPNGKTPVGGAPK